MERVGGGGLHGGRVAFELDQIFAAGARGFVVGVAGVEADEAIGEIGGGEERAGGGHFVFLGLGQHGGDGDGGAGLLRDEADDLGEAAGDGFAVEGERLGQLAVLGLQPRVEDGGEGGGIDPTEERVEHVAAGRDARSRPGVGGP